MNKVTVLVPDTSSAYGDLATITPGAHPIVIAPMTLTPPVIKPKTEKELRAIYNDLLFKIRHNQDTLFKHDFLSEFKDILESIKMGSKVEIS